MNANTNVNATNHACTTSNCAPGVVRFSGTALPTFSDMVASVFGPGALPRHEVHTGAPMTIWTDPTKGVLEMDLPGFSMDQVEITLERDVLTIRGSRTLSRPENAEVLRDERPEGTFERQVRVGDTFDSERISAALKDGVLTVTMPRKPETQPRKITLSNA
ncbi:MAG: Hsp20/alpha crystallin family protein [Phycisphaerales bacterium]|nr:Hsp20/alpha crystallin family protein [Phycisphaerales bacterium]